MIGIFHYRHDIEKTGIVYSYEELNKKTFSPLPCDILILAGARGKTYQERKSYIEDQAITWSYLNGNVTTYYSDLATINEYFTRYGRQYGLLTDFRENGII